MSKLPTLNPEDCIRALQRGGFYMSRQKGSHVQMRRDAAACPNCPSTHQ